MYSIPQSEKAMVMMTGSSSICEEAIPLKSTASSSANVPEPFLVRGWDPLISMAQNIDFDVSTALPSCNVGVVENQGISRFSCLSSGNFSDIMSSFTLLESSQLPSALCPIDFPTSDEKVMEKDSKGKKRRRMPECCDFDSQSPLNRTQNAEAERKDVAPKNVKGLVENDEIKQQAQINLDVNTRKLTSKQSKEHSLNGDAPKEEYLHVRAKRGQATNSHSLAERVRREKISERMRYLQDLVPGCNKITGKAVMLDEIINYVQSLQRQVEVPEAFNVFDAQPVISDGFAQVSNKGGITVICSKRGGDASTNNHNEWLLTVPLVPDVINFTFIPIISLLKDVLGKGFLAHAINLYLRYKPPISELEYFLDFQYHKIWAPTLNEHPLGPCSNRSLPTLALHFNLMGPKLYVNTTQVDGLISIMESENVGPFNLGNPGEFTMQDSYFH